MKQTWLQSSAPYTPNLCLPCTLNTAEINQAQSWKWPRAPPGVVKKFQKGAQVIDSTVDRAFVLYVEPGVSPKQCWVWQKKNNNNNKNIPKAFVKKKKKKKKTLIVYLSLGSICS